MPRRRLEPPWLKTTERGRICERLACLVPGDAARVPTDEAPLRDEIRDALEELRVAAAVRGELGNAGAEVDDRRLRPRRRRRGARLRAQNELVAFDEEDPGPGGRASLDELAYDSAKDLVGLALAGDYRLDRLDCVGGAQSGVPSTFETAARKPPGTCSVRRSSWSIRTIACVAVTISSSCSSSSTLYAA